MKMAGEQRIPVSRERVWEALNDPAVLHRCIPGCRSLDKEGDDRLKAVVEIKIGPIGARFNGAVTLSDIDAPNGYTITGQGQGGVVGSARGGARVRLADDAGGTLLSYDVDAEVGGRLAQLGGPIIDATARQLAGKFFDTFGTVVGGGTGTQEPEATAASATSAAHASGEVATAGPASPTAPAFLPGTAAAGPASHRSPVAWVLALVVAALVGFLVGRGQGGAAGSDWMGLSIGALMVIVAAAGFEFGRRAAAPVVTLDAALFARMVGEARP